MTVIVHMKNGDTLRFEKAKLHVSYGTLYVIDENTDGRVRLCAAQGEWITAKEERP